MLYRELNSPQPALLSCRALFRLRLCQCRDVPLIRYIRRCWRHIAYCRCAAFDCANDCRASLLLWSLPASNRTVATALSPKTCMPSPRNMAVPPSTPRRIMLDVLATLVLRTCMDSFPHFRGFVGRTICRAASATLVICAAWS